MRSISTNINFSGKFICLGLKFSVSGGSKHKKILDKSGRSTVTPEGGKGLLFSSPLPFLMSPLIPGGGLIPCDCIPEPETSKDFLFSKSA